MADYNYAVFDLAREDPVFDAFPNHLRVGQKAPSFPLEDLDTSETVEMRSVWSGQQVAIIEFGSFT